MSASDDDQSTMRLAIAASRQALLAGDMPFGAALARGGACVHISRNEQLTKGDLTAHAELVLVREVSALHGRETLRGGTVYASGEPCAMCAGAMFWAGVARVVYGATTEDIIAALGGPSLPIRSAQVFLGAHPGVQVDGPVLRDEAALVLRLFTERAG